MVNKAMPLAATRLLDQPIIRPNMDRRMGDNINGPALIRMPDWAEARLGRYHLYFSDHKTLPTLSRLEVGDPLSSPSSFLSNTAAGGVLVMKLNVRSW